jgi:dihydroflavonol-4-reductase
LRAFVTGAAGFIGTHVVRALVTGGIDVVAFDRRFTPPDSDRGARTGPAPSAAGSGPAPPPLSELADLVEGDVLDASSVARAMADCDAVFHLAAVYSFARRDAALMQTVNVDGTRTVMDAAARGRARRVIHTSSCATCGPVPGRSATERDLPTPADLRVPYKRTKLAGERVALAAAAAGLDVVVVNPTVPVGAGDLRPTPTGKMVSDVALGRAGGYLARSALNVVSVEDVALGHLRALEHGASGERYLLGGENLSIREVFAQVAVAAGRRAPQLGVPWGVAYAAARLANLTLAPLDREPKLLLLDEVRSGRVPHRFDDAKARAELGYVSRPATEALAVATASALAQAAGA